MKHQKGILFLISEYAVCAETAEDDETWMRQIPLYVLIYEGVLAGCFDFDFAPASYLLSTGNESKRLWMNISQEGRYVLIIQMNTHTNLKLDFE